MGTGPRARQLCHRSVYLMSPLIAAQSDFLLDVSKLIENAHSLGFYLTAGELWRPQVTQDYYFSHGLSKTLHSNHQDRLAIDLNVFLISTSQLATLDQISPLGKFWESLNVKNRWGGHFSTLRDGPHFERIL